jgi:hypothetical protein
MSRLALSLLPLLVGCASTQPIEKLSLEELTARYRQSVSDNERSRVLTRILMAFEELDRTDSKTHPIVSLPPKVQELLMAKVEGSGLDTRRPQWRRAYSCGDFVYVTEFTCDVKHISFDSRTGMKESWYPEMAGDFLLFEGRIVCHSQLW